MTQSRRRKAVSIGLGAIGAVTVLAIAASATDVSSPPSAAPSAESSPSPAPFDAAASPDASASPSASADPFASADPSVTATQPTIENFAFVPPTISVATGTTLTWTNLDLVGHTVTSVDGLFASSLLQNGETFGLSLDEPGTYAYFCAVHPAMTGTLEVVG